jgi:hypothetical protein
MAFNLQSVREIRCRAEELVASSNRRIEQTDEHMARSWRLVAGASRRMRATRNAQAHLSRGPARMILPDHERSSS